MQLEKLRACTSQVVKGSFLSMGQLWGVYDVSASAVISAALFAASPINFACLYCGALLDSVLGNWNHLQQ